MLVGFLDFWGPFALVADIAAYKDEMAKVGGKFVFSRKGFLQPNGPGGNFFVLMGVTHCFATKGWGRLGKSCVEEWSTCWRGTETKGGDIPAVGVAGMSPPDSDVL